ncbi:MAG TPA: MBL fold metallo-hydrolase [Stellaceae bacterium]|nr:MBL fold metallo-hydrolase [Stellaceae bacterium]
MIARIARLLLAAALAAAAGSAEAAARDACDSLVPALVGGPMLPKGSDIAVIRWLGNANYEVGFGGKVYLFDTYYDRVSRSRPLGFSVADVKRADVIFLSHAHFDHMSDIVPVARQTGAKVVGAPITIETAVKLGLPPQQAVTAKGGETLHFGDLTVEIALARHSTIQDGLIDAYANLYKVETRASTPEEIAHTKDVTSRGTFAPDVIDKGTLAFALVLRNGFKIVAIGSAGPITDGDRDLARKLGRADVAIVAYQPHAVAERQIPDTWALIDLFDPRLYLPAHHDHSFGTWLDLGLEPLFQKLRDEKPGTKFAAPLYRSAICVATRGARRGTIVKLRY